MGSKKKGEGRGRRKKAIHYVLLPSRYFTTLLDHVVRRLLFMTFFKKLRSLILVIIIQVKFMAVQSCALGDISRHSWKIGHGSKWRTVPDCSSKFLRIFSSLIISYSREPTNISVEHIHIHKHKLKRELSILFEIGRWSLVETFFLNKKRLDTTKKKGNNFASH